MTFSKKPVKGMADFLPADMRLREAVLEAIKQTYASFGFSQIETPMMEHIGNLTSKQGGDNEKLIFKVLKRGASLDKAWEAQDRDGLVDNGMRYDLTVPLARFYANNKDALPNPFRSLQIGAVWRADQPAKGRFRQFVQCDIDVLGDATNLAEIELISATATALTRVLAPAEVTGLTVHVNDRRILMAAALAAGFEPSQVDSVLIELDKLDKIGFDGVEESLVKAGCEPKVVAGYLDLFRTNQEAGCRAFCEAVGFDGLPEVADGLEEIIASASALTADSVSIVFDPTLVRGMGYYTGPIFEVTIDGFGISIAGGGRYDAMIGKFSGEDVSACGFSIGFERIITVLREAGYDPSEAEPHEAVAFLVDGKASQDVRLKALQDAQALRAQGKDAAVYPMRKNMKRQIAMLEEAGFDRFEKVYAD